MIINNFSKSYIEVWSSIVQIFYDRLAGWLRLKVWVFHNLMDRPTDILGTIPNTVRNSIKRLFVKDIKIPATFSFDPGQGSPLHE